LARLSGTRSPTPETTRPPPVTPFGSRRTAFSFASSLLASGARRAKRLFGKVRSKHSASELAISAASTLADHYTTNAQLFQPHTHAPFKPLGDGSDGNGAAPLKRSQKKVIKRYFGPAAFAENRASVRDAFSFPPSVSAISLS
jgi:hypothetical protein